jgi:hypothetical protein
MATESETDARAQKVLDSVEKVTRELLEKHPEAIPVKETEPILHAVALTLNQLTQIWGPGKEDLVVLVFPIAALPAGMVDGQLRVTGTPLGAAAVFTVDAAANLWLKVFVDLPGEGMVNAVKKTITLDDLPQFGASCRSLVEFVHAQSAGMGMELTKPTQPWAQA